MSIPQKLHKLYVSHLCCCPLVFLGVKPPIPNPPPLRRLYHVVPACVQLLCAVGRYSSYPTYFLAPLLVLVSFLGGHSPCLPLQPAVVPLRVKVPLTQLRQTLPAGPSRVYGRMCVCVPIVIQQLLFPNTLPLIIYPQVVVVVVASKREAQQFLKVVNIIPVLLSDTTIVHWGLSCCFCGCSIQDSSRRRALMASVLFSCFRV